MKQIPISIGEFIDKITILQIKEKRISNLDQLINIKKELSMLVALDTESIVGTAEYYDLKQINEQLWEIEDSIRVKESQKDFGEDFIKLARSVYKLNDQRAAIKKQINLKYQSGLTEEKSYEQ